MRKGIISRQNVTSSNGTSRDHALDNILFLLIFSVVFAHLLEICNSFAGSWLIYKLIYAFHMPAFIFLFGYNIKYSTKRIVYHWCVPYVVFQSAYIFFLSWFWKVTQLFNIRNLIGYSGICL